MGQFLLAVLVFASWFAGWSFVINELWLGPEHEVYAFLRPDTDPRGWTPASGESPLSEGADFRPSGMRQFASIEEGT